MIIRVIQPNSKRTNCAFALPLQWLDPGAAFAQVYGEPRKSGQQRPKKKLQMRENVMPGIKDRGDVTPAGQKN